MYNVGLTPPILSIWCFLPKPPMTPELRHWLETLCERKLGK